jgi:hypothetical protein
MRPVERGPAPRVFAAYQEARNPLIERIGDYCSYCEVALHATVDVEHLRPKSLHPSLETEWSNFLLACTYCNSIKGDNDVAMEDFYWPDVDNTFRTFDYTVDSAPLVATTLNPQQRLIAERTRQLTGLDREPGHPDLSDRDRRWMKRRDVWGVATQARRHLEQQDSEQLRISICYTAISRGFFSVWMVVFHDDPDMRRSS